MLTYKLHLIRHGITAMNREGICMGRLDEPLSQAGADAIARKRRHFTYPEVEAVYTCPLRRSIETARLLLPGLPLTGVEDLAEMAMGDFEGRAFTELQSDPAFAAWLADSAANPPPGGESAEAFAFRLAQGLDGVFKDMQAEKVRSAACVVSGGVLMVLLKAHTRTSEPMSALSCEPLEGRTVTLTTQLWMQHGLVELGAKIPAENAAN